MATSKFRVQHDAIHYLQPLLLYTEDIAQNFLCNFDVCLAKYTVSFSRRRRFSWS